MFRYFFLLLLRDLSGQKKEKAGETNFSEQLSFTCRSLSGLEDTPQAHPSFHITHCRFSKWPETLRIYLVFLHVNKKGNVCALLVGCLRRAGQ